MTVARLKTKPKRRRRKTVIHVNQHIIRSNSKGGKRANPLTIKTYNSNTSAGEAVILDDDGNEVARVVYRPDNPLSCGAKCWIETQCEVVAENVQ